MSRSYDFMLTTTDNPYDPFTQFTDWYKFDMIKGYDCCGLLARESETNDLYGEERNEEIIENAVNRIVERAPLMFKKAILV